MTLQETILSKINKRPETLVKEVNDYIDFILMKNSDDWWGKWILFSKYLKENEEDFSDYLHNLEEYEEKLVRGEIKW